MAPTASYLATVEEVYSSLRRSGLFLSPLDRAQVVEWQQEGVPLPVLLRALAEGLHAYRARGAGLRPGSLRYFREWVRKCMKETVVSAPALRVAESSLPWSPPTEMPANTISSTLKQLSPDARSELGRLLRRQVGRRPAMMTVRAYRDTLRSRLVRILPSL